MVYLIMLIRLPEMRGEWMASRKDDKGYVLWKGESKRKDGYYIYQYKDLVGRRRVAYAKDLPTLRKRKRNHKRFE